MNEPIPIEDWPARLERVIADHDGLWKRVFVLRETDSTQDAARRMNAVAGDVFVAWRQTSGRGRMGRVWADTGEGGVAVTFAVTAGAFSLPVLSVASAVGAARALEQLAGRSIDIKWPNDLEVDGKKLAGILIEQSGDVALIGIGINVSQREWPQDIANRAVSMAELGASVDRLDVLAALLPALDAALHMDAEQLKGAYAMRDVLRGKSAAFSTGDREVSGRVTEIDPLRGLLVRTAAGDQWLEAALTTVIAISR